jgi:hypothetical protein
MDLDCLDEKDEDAEAQAMAAAMGFSGFGKAQAKKRKFNSSTDAYVDGQELAKLDKGGKKGQGSGGNTMPLGKPRVFGGGSNKPTQSATGNALEQKAVVGNSDEIDVDADMDDEDNEPNYIDSSKTPPAAAMEGYQAVDSDLPPPVSSGEAEEMQARIDAILASIGEGDEPNSIPIESSTEDHQQYPRHHQVPQKPMFGDTAFMRGGPRSRNQENTLDSASVASSSRPSHRSERNPTWYIGYYDPSFNENPWGRLEKDRGLEPLCKWPENVGRRQHS